MKAKTMRRSLFMSIVSLLLCMSMLVGTTFAWFTDSVTSANNIIKSGNLDVELYYQVEGKTDWTKVTGTTNVFKENALWEPGHTEVVKLKVVNEGSLALKYQLGVNIAGETGSVNALGADFKLSDHIKFGIVEGAQTYTRDQAVAAVDSTATALKQAYNSQVTTLYPQSDDTTKASEKIVTMVVYMPTSVGNEANHAKDAAQPIINLGINLFATQVEAESDSFGNTYDKDAMTFVESQNAAQAALDNAVPGTIIKLEPGVNYGTLYLRPVKDAAPTKEVDWIGNNYHFETYSLFENLTIVGADGATVDAIVIEGGTYYNTAHSQDEIYPVMLSLVELKNVVIDGVTFTGNGGYDPQGYGNAINLSGGNIKVDGLTLKNCVLNNPENTARLLYKTESTTNVHTYTYEGETFTFSPSMKDITVTGCTFNGGYMGLELRETTNLTITNNTFNVADRNILLPVNTGCTYSGTITITGNVSNNAKERFVRADGTGDAAVVITNNTLNNYQGADADYIKVTNGNNVTIENNTLVSNGVKDADALQAALDNAVEGTTIQLQPGVNYGTVYLRATENNVTSVTCFPGVCGETYSDVDAFKSHWATENTGGGGHHPYYTAAIKNVTIVGADGATIAGVQAFSGHASAGTTDAVLGNANTGSYSVALNISNLTFKDVAFTGKVNIESSHEDAVYDGVTFDGCSFTTGGTDKTNGAAIRYYSEANNGKVKNIVVKDCAFNNCRQGVYTHHVNGVTVTGSAFDTLGHNAIAVQSHSSAAHGNVTITGNTFKNVEDRVIRFNGVDAPTAITIQNNTATNCGDDANEIMKATSIASGVTTSISGNNWGAGKVVANDELKDK